MIPVKPRLAPKGFNKKVLEPGRRWLAARGLPRAGPVPRGTKLKPFWRRCLRALHEKYDGVCAYLCIYIERPLKAHSVDHFVAKSKDIGLAYRWSNYRLACLGENAKKRDFSDILDPFEMEDETFHINFADGRIKPNPWLPADAREKASETILRLGLDSYDCRAMRVEHFRDYHERGLPLDYLERRSPFVWREIVRQGLVK